MRLAKASTQPREAETCCADQKYVDTIAIIVRIAMRQRTSYPKLFKAQVAQECLQPGVSLTSVALRHGINANLVRKWIPAYRDRQEPALPAFVPMKLESSSISKHRGYFQAAKTYREVAVLGS
jgi:transposase-like protein